MKNIAMKPLICIAVVILLGVCAGQVLAEEQTQIFDPVLVDYSDTFVAITSINLKTEETSVIIVFTDSSVFFSTAMFEIMFQLAAEIYMNEPDLNIADITGFGTVDDAGYFGKWTPTDGYSYYPLT